MAAQRVIPSGRLHDDTEEDLVGADWHQEAIRAAVESLRDLAAERRLPWHVGDQLMLIGTKPDGTVWRPSPDIMLHPHAGAARRAEMSVGGDGAPALIIEVASPSTWQYDADTQEGKAWGYLGLGVPNYLVFDPHGNLLGEQCRGWQQQGGTIHQWQPDADGRYRTSELNISLRPDGDLLRVFDAEGRPVAFGFEKAQLIRLQEERIAELEAQLARLREDIGGR